MTTPRSILVATDFSQHARYAALRAAIQARELGIAEVTLLHVIPPMPLAMELAQPARDAVIHALSQHAAELSRQCGVNFLPTVVSGPIAANVVQETSEDFDLIVTGARGSQPWRGLALGTTAERLLRMAKRPVLVVKQNPEASYRTTLVPVDFSTGSVHLLEQARGLAPRSRLAVVHTFEVSFEGMMRLCGASEEKVKYYREQAGEEASKEMVELLGRSGIAIDSNVSASVAHGFAPAAILDNEEKMRADLIVLGKHGKSLLEELLLGSVTLHVLAASTADVLVVPVNTR